MNKHEKILVTGAGGLIGGHLVKYFLDNGFTQVVAVDKKPVVEWFIFDPRAKNQRRDLSDRLQCEQAVSGAKEVYNLAADMGGMGFIELHRVDCMRSVLINTHLIDAACRAQVERYFFASSACVYNTNLQQDSNVTALKEEDAYPAMAERGYGWEKLFSEMLCQEYAAERKMKTFIARFHNVYGPHGTWEGGREKAPAAICRKVIEAVYGSDPLRPIAIWGTGTQTRSFTYIDDCLLGIDKITHCDFLSGKPINLGSSRLISIDDLVTMVEGFEKVKLHRQYQLDAPRGVMGRNSDNTFIKTVLGWEPSTPLELGMKRTYDWVKEQYLRKNAK